MYVFGEIVLIQLIKDNLIRVSVGLEDYQDIQQDLAQAMQGL